MMTKYELTNDTITIGEITLYRIRAKKRFRDVEAGDIGGFVEKQTNLSDDGDAWVYGNACVCGDARVYGDAWVYGNACVSGNACVRKNTHYLTIGPCGSRNAFTTFFLTDENRIHVQCGCFYGGLEEYRAKITSTHGDNKHAQVYLAAIEIAKAQIEDAEQSCGDKIDEEVQHETD